MNEALVLHEGLVESASEVYTSPAHGSLTKAQGLALLGRLVNDEGFRARFEQTPAQAMVELGIPAEQIATLRV